ncbi:MAG: efflux transporter outer membrane subunit [Aquabacterium sp.]|nr:efflux transporter outer membrane subunit [Aquabacterium sp.]
MTPTPPGRPRRAGTVMALLAASALVAATAVAQEAGVPAQPAAAPTATQPASAPAAAPAADDTIGVEWGAMLGDPALPMLVQAALRASPSMAAARGRIERSRTERVAADAAWMPLVTGSGSASRGKTEPQLPITTSSSAGIQASWELDLFGAGRAGSAAEAARLGSAEQALAGMRLSVAAETGQSYVALRACEAQRALAEQEVASHSLTERINENATEAGFFSSDQAAMARAAAAQARAVLGSREDQCARLLRSIATLAALDEADLRQQLAPRTGVLPMPMAAVPDELPADLLMRRPDLQEAALAVTAAGFDGKAMRAQQWPTISLQGAIGRGRLGTPQASFSGQVWSFGPLQITMPIFDSGVRKARVKAADASLDEARAVYLARVRLAAEEIDTTLSTLRGISVREQNARQAALGFGVALSSAELRLQGGMGSVLELEHVRRIAAQARSSVVDLQQARASAWITLYRVMGGRW